MGFVSVIISLGTIFSSLQSDRLTKKLGAGRVTAISVGLTALALLGFSASHHFWMLCLFAVPYGLGAGSVDAALNNYVALHYSSKHMSWLHCMWGIGASAGPYILSFAMSGGQSWNAGYLYVGLIQIALTALLIFSLPLWKGDRKMGDGSHAPREVMSLPQIVRLAGAEEIMVTFFCYCALESTAGLWSASYMVAEKGLTTTQAASFASLFYLGITLGRAVNGFLSMRFTDTQLIRLGQVLIGLGIAVLFIPTSLAGVTLVGLLLVGLGCAPIYPCIIHSRPTHFGAERSQAIIGVQMASAYLGSTLMPPLFGLIANHITTSLFPAYLVVILLIMIIMHEQVVKVHQ